MEKQMIDPDTPLDQIEWRIRTAAAFSHLGLKTVGDVQRVGSRRLLQEPNFGRKSLHEVEEIIGPLGDYSRQTHDPALSSFSSRRLLDELARRLNVSEPEVPLPTTTAACTAGCGGTGKRTI
jgi:hypothetical protein